jgi:outer membrane protein W
LDFKYIFLSPNASVNAPGAKIRSNNFDLNPMIFGAGIGYKF